MHFGLNVYKIERVIYTRSPLPPPSMPTPNLYWFEVTTTQHSGRVGVDQYDTIQRAPRAFAWWIGRPMEKMTETMNNRGILVSVEVVQGR